MQRTEIYKKIVKLQEHKDEHLKRYAEDLKSLAENKDTMIFQTGGCLECERVEKEIAELEELLKK